MVTVVLLRLELGSVAVEWQVLVSMLASVVLLRVELVVVAVG